MPDGAEHLEPLLPQAGIWQQLEEAAMGKGRFRCELAGESLDKPPRRCSRTQGRSGQVLGHSCSSGGWHRTGRESSVLAGLWDVAKESCG